MELEQINVWICVGLATLHVFDWVGDGKSEGQSTCDTPFVTILLNLKGLIFRVTNFL